MDWINLGLGLAATGAAGASAWSATKSHKAAGSMLDLEKQREAERITERLRPKFTVNLIATRRGLPSALHLRLDGPNLLAEQFGDLKVWVLLDESMEPQERIARLGDDERAHEERQFWSPWRFDTSEGGGFMESPEKPLKVFGTRVLLLEPTPRVTNLFTDAQWESALFANPLVVEVGARLDDAHEGRRLAWWDRREVEWMRTWPDTDLT